MSFRFCANLNGANPFAAWCKKEQQVALTVDGFDTSGLLTVFHECASLEIQLFMYIIRVECSFQLYSNLFKKY